MISEPADNTATMTLEEFLSRPDSNQPMEYEDGGIIVFPMPTPKHQSIVLNIADLIKRTKPNGKRFVAPVDVVMGDRVYQPDVFWIKEGGACVNTGAYFEGPPDLAVEIVSPSTGKRDRRDKFFAYEQHGVGEYWIVEPDQQVIEVYTLINGKYQRHGVFGPEDTFTSPVLGADKPINGAQIFSDDQ